jgi:hypothetical protein
VGSKSYIGRLLFQAFTCVTISLFFSACVTRPQPQRQFSADDKYAPVREKAAGSRLYHVIPPSIDDIRWYDLPRWTTWNLAGNDDDGIFGERQLMPYSTNISTSTFLKWTVRNPFHNCFFYTMGSAGWTNHYSLALVDVDSGEGTRFVSPDQGRLSGGGRFGFRFALHDYKPFLGLNIPYLPKHRFEFYLGWRERGNFGIKLKPWVRK